MIFSRLFWRLFPHEHEVTEDPAIWGDPATGFFYRRGEGDTWIAIACSRCGRKGAL